MSYPLDPATLNAPYSEALAQTAGWRECVEGLDILYHDNPARYNEDATFYVKFGFMDGGPMTVGTMVDPPNDYYRRHGEASVDIFQIVRDSLVPVLEDTPTHNVYFRYRKREGWAAVGKYDEMANQWDVWRARRTELNELRSNWFKEHAFPEKFETVSQGNLEVLIDQKHRGWELFPLCIGLAKKEIWMMTSGFTNPPSPRQNDPYDTPGCSVEIMFRAPRPKQFSLEQFRKSSAFEAISLMGEAFYWRFVKPDQVPPVDLSEPISLSTLDDYSHSFKALAPSTPFFISAAVDEPVDLGQGRQFTPAFVTIEKPIARKLPKAVSAKLHGWTGSLGKAQRKFDKPSSTPLLKLIRAELKTHDTIKTESLIRRLESYAALEFYYDRYLPVDIAPYLQNLDLYAFGQHSYHAQVKRVKEQGDFDTGRHTQLYILHTDLRALTVYEGLQSLDYGSVTVDDLDWLHSVPWLKELSSIRSMVRDYSALAAVPELVSLKLMETELQELSAISTLSKLERLDISVSLVEDISPLQSLPQLKELSLTNLKLKDLNPIKALTQLEKLGLTGQSIADLSFLESCPNIRWLSLSGTDVTDLTLLPDLPNLEELLLAGTGVQDLSPLQRFPKLNHVNVINTAVTDWHPVDFVKTVVGRPKVTL